MQRVLGRKHINAPLWNPCTSHAEVCLLSVEVLSLVLLRLWRSSLGYKMSVTSPSPKINLYSRAHWEAQRFYIKSEIKKRWRKKKKLVFNESNVVSYIQVCQLPCRGIINYPGAINKNIICPNNLILPNNAKCSTRNFHTIA